jgi:hypothetical protein
MLGLAILFAAVGLGFAIGYGTRGVVSRKRRSEYLAYAPYLDIPQPNAVQTPAREPERPRMMSIGSAVSMLADRLSFALALDFAVALLVILLLPRSS